MLSSESARETTWFEFPTAGLVGGEGGAVQVHVVAGGERQLLSAWMRLYRDSNPDCIVGWKMGSHSSDSSGDGNNGSTDGDNSDDVCFSSSLRVLSARVTALGIGVLELGRRKGVAPTFKKVCVLR